MTGRRAAALAALCVYSLICPARVGIEELGAQLRPELWFREAACAPGEVVRAAMAREVNSLLIGRVLSGPGILTVLALGGSILVLRLPEARRHPRKADP